MEVDSATEAFTKSHEIRNDSVEKKKLTQLLHNLARAGGYLGAIVTSPVRRGGSTKCSIVATQSLKSLNWPSGHGASRKCSA
eukprot:6479252-Amphidinium_carterae.2